MTIECSTLDPCPICIDANDENRLPSCEMELIVCFRLEIEQNVKGAPDGRVRVGGRGERFSRMSHRLGGKWLEIMGRVIESLWERIDDRGMREIGGSVALVRRESRARVIDRLDGERRGRGRGKGVLLEDGADEGGAGGGWIIGGQHGGGGQVAVFRGGGVLLGRRGGVGHVEDGLEVGGQRHEILRSGTGGRAAGESGFIGAKYVFGRERIGRRGERCFQERRRRNRLRSNRRRKGRLIRRDGSWRSDTRDWCRCGCDC